MSEDAPDSERPVRGSRWSDTPSRDALQAIAEGVAEAAGFDLVGISVARDDGYLHTLVLVGPEEARRVLIDSLAPVDQLLVQLETAEDWGALKFIPHDKLVLDIEKWGWFSDAPRDNVAAGAWHPEDMLIAPLEGADGAFLGFLGMELPRDGLVPSAEKRAMLEICARQAGRAVITTLERERLAERVRLAGTAADIVRLASGTQSPEARLAECGREVARGFRADSLWIQLLGPDHRCDGPLHVDGGPTVRLPSGVRALVSAHAQRAWERQCVAVLAPDRAVPGVLGAEQVAELLDFFASVEVGSLLFVPLGAGPECFGAMGLTRGHHGAEWSDEEVAAALDVGRDLGRALANARTFAREHELVQELQDLADYKGRLGGDRLPRAEEPAERDPGVRRDARVGAEPQRPRTSLGRRDPARGRPAHPGGRRPPAAARAVGRRRPGAHARRPRPDRRRGPRDERRRGPGARHHADRRTPCASRRPCSAWPTTWTRWSPTWSATRSSTRRTAAP
jgi:GAF domain-containing protein